MSDDNLPIDGMDFKNIDDFMVAVEQSFDLQRTAVAISEMLFLKESSLTSQVEITAWLKRRGLSCHVIFPPGSRVGYVAVARDPALLRHPKIMIQEEPGARH